MFLLQLNLSLLTLHWPESAFHFHNNLIPCTTKVFFSIVSIKINTELRAHTQYLYLQLDFKV